MIQVDLRSRTPIYEQLVQNIKELIISEILKPDEKLPSVRSLSTQLTINPNTIQKSYRELERQGYIYSMPSRGSFVASRSDVSCEKLSLLKDELRKLITESLYIGMKKKEIVDLVEEIDFVLRGGDKDDKNR